MTDIGGLIYDKDATFLEMHGSQKNIGASIPNIDDRRVPLINEMKKANLGHDSESDDDDDQGHLRLFAGSDAITANESGEDDSDAEDDDDYGDEQPRIREEKVVDGGRVRRKAVFDRDAPDVAGHSDDGGSDDEQGKAGQSDSDGDEDLAFEDTDDELGDDDDDDDDGDNDDGEEPSGSDDDKDSDDENDDDDEEEEDAEESGEIGLLNLLTQ